MLRQQSKKGISEMVSYVLLVVIAISLSIGVYSYLKLQIPQEIAECGEDISLVVKDVSCNTGSKALTVTLQNKGLFNIDGAFIRFSEAGRVTRVQLNEGNETFPPRGLSSGPLKPGETFLAHYNIAKIIKPNFIDYVLEIQPAIIQDNHLTPCEEGVISTPVRCDFSEGLYQEDASSYECGAVLWDPSCDLIYDGDWGTHAWAIYGYLNITYNKPANSQNTSIWKIKHGANGGTTHDIAIPQECWTQEKLKFELFSNYFTGEKGSKASCWNGMSWVVISSKLGSQDKAHIYEEAMIWNFTAPSTTSGPICGDGNCDPGENSINCAVDCSIIPISCGTGHTDNGDGTCTATLTTEDPSVQRDGYVEFDGASQYTRWTTGEEIIEKSTAGYKQRGFMSWDTSSMPDTAIISTIEFSYHGTYEANKGQILSSMNTNPTDYANDQALFNDIGAGNQYYGNSGDFIQIGYKTVPLAVPPAIISDILANDWFAMGLYSASNDESKIASSNNPDSAKRPTIIINYTICGDEICVPLTEDNTNCQIDCP